MDKNLKYELQIYSYFVKLEEETGRESEVDKNLTDELQIYSYFVSLEEETGR